MKSQFIYMFCFLVILTMLSCSRTNFGNSKFIAISKSCEFNGKLNDTLIIDGVYTRCMEYSSFKTIIIDECISEYDMYLNLSEEGIKKSIRKEISRMYTCNASRRMIVKGIIKKEKSGYGHLGTNNAEIYVIEIILLDKIKN